MGFSNDQETASSCLSRRRDDYADRCIRHRSPPFCRSAIGPPRGSNSIDTFDYKPELQKYAGKALPPDKSYINSGGRKVVYLTPNWRKFRPGGQSGLLISDYFPNLREHTDKLAVIRSCHADSHAHGSALVQMNTGIPLIGKPSLGSWVAYALGSDPH